MNASTTHADPIAAFADAIAAAGLTPPRQIVADGRLHRFAPNGNPRDDAGYYVLHVDGLPAGIFGSWRDGIQRRWSAKGLREMTAEERRQQQRRIAQARAERERERRENARRARETAARLWPQAEPAGADNPYLRRKQVAPVKGLRRISAARAREIVGYKLKAKGEPLRGELLVVPLRAGGEMQGLQFIDGDGRKHLLSGTLKAGAYCGIKGARTDAVAIAEGLATALSIREATGLTVVVAFDAGNLPAVAPAVRAQFPDATLLLCGDHDDNGVGRRKSQEAARAVGGTAVVPEQPGDWNDAHVRDGIEAVRRAFDAVLDARAPSPPEPPADDAPPPEPEDYGAPGEVEGEGNPYFRPLGYNRGRYYVLAGRGQQVLEFSARALGDKRELLQLAPLQWWEREFPADKGFTGQAVDQAANWLIGACYHAGLYDPDRVRGRGAWLDDGRAVLHLGDRLLVDGAGHEVSDLPSRYIYERAAALAGLEAAPAGAKEAYRLAEICADLRWERAISAKLLAGWIAIAPICGALRWRPSIWITGPSGSGKTYVLERIIRGVLGNVALPVQSKTSEAGIRQRLGRDALPVVFDEAEPEDLRDRTRMQGVIDLVRQSASEGGAEIIKGTQTHEARSFRIRSAFAFCSINVGVEHYADESRITTLSLVAPDKSDEEARALAQGHFEDLDRRVTETLTPEFGARLLARSVSLMEVIRDNARTFGQAAALELGDQRIGDQLGALLAGAYSLHSAKRISYDDALAWIRRQEWTGSTAADAEQDHERLLAYIIQSQTRVASPHGSAIECSFGELIDAALGQGSADVSQDVARKHLLRHGIRPQQAFSPVLSDVTADGVWISRSHHALKRLLHNTPWASRWGDALARLDGAVRSEPRCVRFGSTGSTKAVFVPKETIYADDS